MGDTTIKNWARDLPGLTDAALLDRVALARRLLADSERRGAGRNPKAARMWREKLREATDEVDRRGLRP